MNLIFRNMESTDLESVKLLDKLAFPNPWPENAFQYEIENNKNARLWVGEVDEGDEKTIIALAVVWIILDEAHIGTFAVHPDQQHKGIGHLLLATICEKLIDEHITRIFLEVRKSNIQAISLYRNFGFDIDGERKKYYRDNGETAILMSAPINDKDFYQNLFLKYNMNYQLDGREIEQNE